LIGLVSIIGIISRIIDPNVIFDYFLSSRLFIYRAIILSSMFEHHEIPDYKTDTKKEILETFKLIAVFNIPIFIGVIIFDWSALHTLTAPIWPWKWTFLLYLGLFTLLLYWTHFSINYFSLKKHGQYGILMVGVWIIVAIYILS